MVNVLFGKFRFLCTLLRGKKKEIVYNCYQLQTRHLTEISAEQANMRLYIYTSMVEFVYRICTSVDRS